MSFEFRKAFGDYENQDFVMVAAVAAAVDYEQQAMEELVILQKKENLYLIFTFLKSDDLPG